MYRTLFASLREYALRIHLAGGVEDYYDSGGQAGPWGPKGDEWLRYAGKLKSVHAARNAVRRAESSLAKARAELERSERAWAPIDLWGDVA